MTSEVLGRYRLLSKIAEGGMAEIFLAKQEGLGGFEKHVVVKKILPEQAQEEKFISMFLSEARLVAQLSHPNIVQVLDVGKEEESFFLVMEYIHGHDLHDILAATKKKTGRALPIPIAVRLIADVCSGLSYAHRYKNSAGQHLKLVHRDLSPHNLFLSYEGTVKILDFGIAKTALSEVKTQTGVIKGKITYLSPEQLGKKPAIDLRSDIFALGICLYELTTGSLPFFGEQIYEIFMKILTGEYLDPQERMDGFPYELARIIHRALALEPDDRYQNAEDFRDDLDDFLREIGQRVRSSDLQHYLSELLPAKSLEELLNSSGPIPSGHFVGSKGSISDPTSSKVLGELSSGEIPKQSVEPVIEVVQENVRQEVFSEFSLTAGTDISSGFSNTKHLDTNEQLHPKEEEVLDAPERDFSEQNILEPAVSPFLSKKPIIIGMLAIAVLWLLFFFLFGSEKKQLLVAKNEKRVATTKLKTSTKVLLKVSEKLIPQSVKRVIVKERKQAVKTPNPRRQPVVRKKKSRSVLSKKKPEKRRFVLLKKRVIALQKESKLAASVKEKKQRKNASASTGSLNVRSRGEVHVYWKGSFLGISPLKKELPVGNYTIRLKDPSFGFFGSRRVKIREKQSSIIRIRSGRLKVLSKEELRISLSGRLLKDKNIELSVGTYSLGLQANTWSRKFTIHIKARRTLRFQVFSKEYIVRKFMK